MSADFVPSRRPMLGLFGPPRRLNGQIRGAEKELFRNFVALINLSLRDGQSRAAQKANLACRVFTSRGGGGGVNRAPQNWGGGGSGKGLN